MVSIFCSIVAQASCADVLAKGIFMSGIGPRSAFIFTDACDRRVSFKGADFGFTLKGAVLLDEKNKTTINGCVFTQTVSRFPDTVMFFPDDQKNAIEITDVKINCELSVTNWLSKYDKEKFPPSINQEHPVIIPSDPCSEYEKWQ